jgi:hypothetical protein
MSAGTGTTDNAEKLLALLGSTSTAVTEPAKLTESGKAIEVAQKSTVVLTVKGKAAGKIQVGSTEKVEGYEIPVEVPASTTVPFTIPLPTGWWIKTTLTEGTISKGVVTPL